VSYIITLGVGTPASIPTFILVGLSPEEEVPFVPVVIMDLRTTFHALEAGESTITQAFGTRSVFDSLEAHNSTYDGLEALKSTFDASIDLRGNLD
jgi:hypothetical protein